MSKNYQRLREQFQRLAHIEHAITFLQWDQLVMMPPAGSETRAAAIAELLTLHHQLLCSPHLGDLLADAEDTDPIIGRSLVEMERVRQRAVCLPEDLVKAKSLAGSRCEHGWRTQRKENDWPGFLKNFKEVVNLSREEAQARQSHARESSSVFFASPYDAMLDLHCTGDGSALIHQVFTDLKKEIPPLLSRIIEKQRSQNPAPLNGSYAIESQIELNRKLMQCLGFDFEAGRLDISLHPFSTGGKGDQRITTRFRRTDFIDALSATAHETGHASYEAGLPDQWHGLPLGRARNMCIHESQSLLFEKQLFLSPAFISFFTGTIHQFLPETKAISSDSLWSACTRVSPSLIRVEADEVTYPLHIILRFEIETDLINGKLKAEEIPEVWDVKMQQHLGLTTAGNYTDGCLQDIHWTDGSFGYFPSYTMGALNAAQLFAAICRRHPNWKEMLAKGDIGFIREWLHSHIWSKGCSMDSQDLLKSATGETTSTVFFLEHLKNRYLEQEN